MLEVQKTLIALAVRRPIFHSEADFQHALAWEIHERLPKASVRLELPVEVNKQNLHIDIWIVTDAKVLAIELKYKTRKLSCFSANEQFRLKDQSAQDIGRYDFIKDIQRLEHLAHCQYDLTGYAILLTNDRSYWQNSISSNTADADYRVNDGRILSGVLDWGVNASDGTKKNREQPLSLYGNYSLNWEDFSIPCRDANGVFRYLTVKVAKTTVAGR